MVVRYGFFAAEKDDDVALDLRVEAMCREIGSRAKNDESAPVIPEGVCERPVSSSAPPASAMTASAMTAAVPQVPASAQSFATGPAAIPPPSQPAQSSSAADNATLFTGPIDMVATMREIQVLVHAEADRAQARAEAQQKAIREAIDNEREACAPKPVFSDDQIRALQVLSTTHGRQASLCHAHARTHTLSLSLSCSCR